ncbi:MAG: hypothetical protein RRY29_05385 [Desulfovibrionaceae bacterium]
MKSSTIIEVVMRVSSNAAVYQNPSFVERRKSFRVCPPPSLVREIALWFKAPCATPTLNLTELGVPHLLSMHGEKKIQIKNISAAGICFSIDKAAFPPSSLLKCGHCYIYLKLLTPLPGKNTLRCLLLGMKLLGLSSDENTVQLRCQTITRAKPAGASKSFSLFNADRVGIKEISVWCDEIARMGRGLLPPITTCLDMENLLVEIFLQQSTTENIVSP